MLKNNFLLSGRVSSLACTSVFKFKMRRIIFNFFELFTIFLLAHLVGTAELFQSLKFLAYQDQYFMMLFSLDMEFSRKNESCVTGTVSICICVGNSCLSLASAFKYCSGAVSSISRSYFIG